jgi:hypothetical protein
MLNRGEMWHTQLPGKYPLGLPELFITQKAVYSTPIFPLGERNKFHFASLDRAF